MRFHIKLFFCLALLGYLVSASDAFVRRDVTITSIPDAHATTHINTHSELATSIPTATTGLAAASTSMIDIHTDIVSGAAPTSLSSSLNSTSDTFNGIGLPLRPTITPAIAIAGVVLIITGIAYNLIGIKNLWIHVFLSAAFLTSLSITVLIEYVMNPPVSNGVQGAYFVAVLLTGLIFGGISLVFKELTEGLGCLLGGFCLSMWFLSLKDGGLLTGSTNKGAFIGAFCVVVYAFSFTSYTRPYALIVSTAFAGSTATILGIDCFSRAGLKEFWLYIWGLNDDVFPLNTTTYPLTRGIRVELAAIIVVCFLGVLSQFRLWKVIRDRRQKQEAVLAEEQQKKDEAELELGRTLEEEKLRELARWEAVYGEQSKSESTIAEKSVVTPGLHRTHSAPDILRKDSEADVEMVVLSVREGHKGVFAEKTEEDVKGANNTDEEENHKETVDAQSSEKPEAGDGAKKDTEHGQANETPENPPVRVPTPLQCVQSPPFKIPNPNEKGQENDVHSIEAIVDDDESIANRLSRRLSGVSILQRLTRRNSSRRNSTHINSRQITSDSEEMLVPQSPSSPASSVQGIPDDISFEMQHTEPHAVLDAESNAEIYEDRNDALKEFTPNDSGPNPAPEEAEDQNSTLSPTAHEESQSQPDQEPAIETITEKENEKQNAEQPHGLGLSSEKHRHTLDGGSSSFLEVTPAPARSLVASTAETGSRKGKSVESPKIPQQAQLRPQPSSNSPSSTGKKESLTAGAVEHLPSHVSPLITSYRTNEWAKHLSVADTPALEDIELSPTLVNSDEESTVPVKVEELTQTATTAAPPPAVDRRASLPEKLDTVQRASSNVSRRSALEAASQRSPSIYMDNAARFPANIHAASSPDLLLVNPTRSPLSSGIQGGFRSSSTPFLGTSLVTSPIDESQVVNYDSQPVEGSLSLMAQREQMVQSRMSSVSLTRHSWMPQRSQSRQSGDEDLHPRPASQLNLAEDDDDMPLAQRRALLRQQSVSPVNMAPKTDDQSRPTADIYPVAGRLSRDPRGSVQSKTMQMAAWRESLQGDLTRSQTPLVDVDMARQGLMDQQRRAQIAKTQRALASENLDNSIAERMRRGEMQDVHREAMRRMQAAANRKAQDEAQTVSLIQRVGSARPRSRLAKALKSKISWCFATASANSTSLIVPSGKAGCCWFGEFHISSGSWGRLETAVRRLLVALRVLFASTNTASSARHQFSHNLSPLAAKNSHRDFSTGELNIHIATPPPLHHAPDTHVRGHQRVSSRNHVSFSCNNNPQPRAGAAAASSVKYTSRPWNPINHVPRTTVVTTTQFAKDSNEDLRTARDAYPLLSIPEQRRSRQAPSPSSLAVERSAAESESGRTSIALPYSRRRSEQLNVEVEDSATMPEEQENRAPGQGQQLQPDDGVTHPPRHVQSNSSLRNSTYATYPAQGNQNTGSDEAEVAEELAWGPAHPCYPHLNPHVPLHSDEFTTTRIIRIRRDWMVKGDLAPTFSNLYPEILDPLVSEQEFRRIVSKINSELVKAFDPWSLRNWLDGAIGLITGWVFDDLSLPGIKSHLRRVEDWLDTWNREVGSKEGVQIWSLRRTAYMTIDIQIPDPKIGLINSEAPSAPGTRPNTGPTSQIPATTEETRG
ncbi:Myb-like protein X [Talaromyces islandicus]|uniref:Myb-like protein X n=1 Tax=Talaromyces islandicus TaxID=28573 RepID=A0A0U1LVG6_TALIS|nr:Myb-like protein X [Talaromyces islandicus]